MTILEKSAEVVSISFGGIERSQGVTRIPHELLAYAIRETKTRRELVVYFCLIRHTLGYQSATSEMSESFIAKWCGLEFSNCAKTLKALSRKGLIVREKAGRSYQEWSIWRVIEVEKYLLSKNNSQVILGSEKKDSEGENEGKCAQNDDPEKKGSLVNLTGEFSQSDQGSLVNLTPNKDNYKEKKKEESQKLSVSPEELFNLWNKKRGSLPEAKLLTSKRAVQVKSRLKEYPDLSSWESVIETLAASSFCRGSNDRGWQADFDFLLKPDTYIRTLEGRYGSARVQSSKVISASEIFR